MDQLGYSDDEAVKKVGIVLSIGCILTVLSFAASGPLARRLEWINNGIINTLKTLLFWFSETNDITSYPLCRITERKTLVLFGLIPLLLCHVVLLPYPGPLPRMQQQTHSSKYTQLNTILCHYNLLSVCDILSRQTDQTCCTVSKGRTWSNPLTKFMSTMLHLILPSRLRNH